MIRWLFRALSIFWLLNSFRRGPRGMAAYYARGQVRKRPALTASTSKCHNPAMLLDKLLPRGRRGLVNL